MLFYTRDHYINDFNHAHRLITVRIINNGGGDDGGSPRAHTYKPTYPL